MDVTLDSICDICLYQSRSGYRFSVDALLLSDFVNLKKAENIADFGAGSGIVGMLLAKKYPSSAVTLFEIQKSLMQLAEKNTVLNNLADRVKVILCDLRTLPGSFSSPPHFDLVVSNPPFRKIKSGLINVAEEKAIARHEIKLNINELIQAASALLRAKGRLCLIYHPTRLSELIDALKKNDFAPKRLRFVHSHRLSDAKMVLLEAAKAGKAGLKVERPFCLYREDGSYPDELSLLYGL